MRLTRIYTKTGDKGSTALASGKRVAKSDLRIEAYGNVDELNATVGFLRDSLCLEKDTNFNALISALKLIQNELFDLGGELSMPPEMVDVEKHQIVRSEQITRLETEIDQMNESLPPLSNFVLPGGAIANSAAHLARTVCRRAEREIIRLSEKEYVRDEVKTYVNRLSDWLFVASRKISHELGLPETLWNQNKKRGK